MAKDALTIRPELLEISKKIFETLSKLRAEKSFSFSLTPEGADALKDAVKIVEWGIGGNKPKLKATAQEIMAEMVLIEHGKPINVNLTEYEVKAMEEVFLAIEKAAESHKEGVLAE
jgi:hypothetical protein